MHIAAKGGGVIVVLSRIKGTPLFDVLGLAVKDKQKTSNEDARVLAARVRVVTSSRVWPGVCQ